MDSEAKEYSTSSIQYFVGREVQEFDIFKQRNTILLVAMGKCLLAIEARPAAKLQRRRNYNQHMTVGIFKNLDQEM